MSDDSSIPPATVVNDTLKKRRRKKSPKRPGWKTSEFWLKNVAMVLTALYASGVIPTGGQAAQVAAIIATMLGSMGYTVARTVLKNGDKA